MADESTLSIQTERVEKAVIVSPLGRVDGSNAAVLESAIQEQLEAGEKVLVFDFKDLNYISSAGLRVFLMTARRLQGEGGKTLFFGLSGPIAHIFEISGFSAILSIYGNRGDALAAL